MARNYGTNIVIEISTKRAMPNIIGITHEYEYLVPMLIRQNETTHWIEF